MPSGDDAFTTRVVKRAAGPRTVRAATDVASLVVDAGVSGTAPPRLKRMRPDAVSVTTAPTCGPSAGDESSRDSAAVRPARVGSAADVPPGASTVPARTTGRVATRGSDSTAR